MSKNYGVMHSTDAQGIKYYDYTKKAVHRLFRLLDLSRYYPHFFDASDALLLKIGGYNCSIGSILFNLETRPFTSLVYSAPLLGRWFCQHRYRSMRAFEVDLDLACAKREMRQDVYSSVFLATLNNYLNPLMSLMQTKLVRGERVLLILPRCSQEWLNYPKVRAISNLDIVFLEDMLPQDVNNKLDEIRRGLSESYQRHADSIIRLFQFNGRRFGQSVYPVMGRFLGDFVAPHIVITNYLYEFLQSVIQPHTEFYIARNRRAIENSFVQIANHINGNTNMILHGMIFPNLTIHLFSYNFGAVRRVYVWGQQGKDVVQWRQKMLGEPCPVIMSQSHFGSSQEAIKCSDSKKNKVLFAGQSITHPFIQRIAKRIPPEIDLVIRVHPRQRYKLKQYRIKKPNVYFDDLRNPIEDHFVDTKIFVSFSSTTILEAIYNDIPTLILNFEELKQHPNVFRQTNLSKQEQAVIMLEDIEELIRKSQLILYDDQFRASILELNRRMMSYFINSSNNPYSDKRTMYMLSCF